MVLCEDPREFIASCASRAFAGQGCAGRTGSNKSQCVCTPGAPASKALNPKL